MPNIADGRNCFVVTIDDTHSFKGVGPTQKAAKTAAAKYAIASHRPVSTPKKIQTTSVGGNTQQKRRRAQTK